MRDATTWQKQAENMWNGQAPIWNENSKQMWKSGSRKEIMPFLKANLETGAKVLDLGCASGYSSQLLYEAGYQVEGMDISSEMIDLATNYYPHIAFQQGDINNLPFKDGHADAILSINVLEWVESPIIAIKELNRVLKVGGKAFIGVLGPTAGPRTHAFDRFYDEQMIMNTMQAWEFAQLAKELGFKEVDGFAVPKSWNIELQRDLPIQAQQALSFMWVFMLEKIR